MSEDAHGAWSQTTRDRWFYLYLSLSTGLLAYLLSPYLMVMLFAAVTVVVTWPVYSWILSRTKERRAVSSVLTTCLLALVVFGPLTFLGYLFALEAVAIAGPAVEYLKDLKVDEVSKQVEGALETYQDPRISAFLEKTLPEDFEPLQAILGPAKDAAMGMLNAAGTLVPSSINTIVNGSIDAAIFIATVISLYMEGPRVLDVARNMSPLDDRYEVRLFHVFREFATNMVVGSVATAAAMGLVAAVGYAIAGVDGVIFFGILTAVCSFVPVVGAMVIWVPLTLSVGWTSGWGWAVFLAVWSIIFTGTVDNILKPFFLRGSSNIHPLLIFLAVFGGMSWVGLPGVLIGPVIVAFFLALYRIYEQDFLRVIKARESGAYPVPPVVTPEEPQVEPPLKPAVDPEGEEESNASESAEEDGAEVSDLDAKEDEGEPTADQPPDDESADPSPSESAAEGGEEDRSEAEEADQPKKTKEES